MRVVFKNDKDGKVRSGILNLSEKIIDAIDKPLLYGIVHPKVHKIL